MLVCSESLRDTLIMSNVIQCDFDQSELSNGESDPGGRCVTATLFLFVKTVFTVCSLLWALCLALVLDT